MTQSLAAQNLTIVRVDDENFAKFVCLIEKLAEYEKLDPPDDQAKNRLKKDGLSENPKYETYLGKINNQFVSYITFFMTYSSFLARQTLYLEDLFVLREYRKKGIGQRMFAFCVQQARDRNCGRMEWCVLNWNTPAINFYKKNGANQLDWAFFRLTRDEIKNYPLKIR